MPSLPVSRRSRVIFGPPLVDHTDKVARPDDHVVETMPLVGFGSDVPFPALPNAQTITAPELPEALPTHRSASL